MESAGIPGPARSTGPQTPPDLRTQREKSRYRRGADHPPDGSVSGVLSVSGSLEQPGGWEMTRTSSSTPVTIREAVVRSRGQRRRVAALRDPGDAASFARRLIAGDAREHFVVLLLDGRHRMIAYQVVSVGT